jgi:FtsP/CotA-like multicopper oxidase with cupredoxin domain
LTNIYYRFIQNTADITVLMTRRKSMRTRKVLNLLFAFIFITSLLLAGGVPIQAQSSEPPPPGEDGLNHIDGAVSPADRQAAAERASKLGQLPGVAGKDPNAIETAEMDPGGIPHYYGPYANYANSPMPKGSIGSIVVDAGGSGYTTATVEVLDVYGTGTGAQASATIVGGVITNIVVNPAGSGYTAPIVTITGDGVDAAATPILALSADYTQNGGIRKFVDALPNLFIAGVNTVADADNDLGQYIPVAIPDKTTFPNADYYEIEVGEYSEQLHSDLPPTKLRGYRQTNTADTDVAKFNYLGPVIVATADRPVRIKFTNSLPTGTSGNLFIPVDTTVMGAGMGSKDAMGNDCDPMMEPMPGMPLCAKYPENRATLHLHGGLVPWISDGTPHQWITPAGENTPYPKGVSVSYVPDMWFDAAGQVIASCSESQTCSAAGANNNPGDGSMTFYYNNQESARLMFYHDHSYGITRLNVYAGEAAGYLVTDAVEQDLINGTDFTGVNPNGFQLPQANLGLGIPLVIQDKTFIDASTIAAQDPTWNWDMDPTTQMPRTGSLWVPHVYMPAQNPWDLTGASAFGRWQYGPWFWPPTSNTPHQPVANEYYSAACDPNLGWCEPPMRPDVPNNSVGMESFNDTPMVNGTVYPFLEVDPTLVRFRILNAANDRFFNLHMYVADPGVVTADGRLNTEVKMVPAVATPGFPDGWSTDGREGGVPDPATMGPSWIQIGTEGGFLPQPVVIPPQPINWNTAAVAFNFGNVTDHSLLVGCAERADVLVDFSQFAGQTLILYNDAPAAFPALDPRYDYYTGNLNQMDTGGTPTTQPGYGPNTRTVMQIRVKGTAAGQPLSGVSVVNGGSDYINAPEVVIGAPNILGGTQAVGVASGGLDHITVLTAGTSYTGASVAISAPQLPGGVQAVAAPVVTLGRVTGFTITERGSGYTAAPTITINGTTGSGASAQAALTITDVTLTEPGTGYTLAPTVSLIGGAGYDALAFASLVTGPAYDMAPLTAVFSKDAANGFGGVFATGQEPILVPQAAYNAAYGSANPDDPATYVTQHEFEKTFATGPLAGKTIPIEPKAIQDEMGEAFDEFGRMSGFLGLEQPVTTAGGQKFVLYGYASPPVDIMTDSTAVPLGALEDGTQIWKITHNGVDTHPMHFHLFNVQLINRVAWDGALLPPEPNELGWKETVRVNPLEHTIVAMRPVAPTQPFDVPNSVRLMDPTMPEGAELMPPPGGWMDPSQEPLGAVINKLVNYGWEYVWHCHILSHEEMDMMHSLTFAVKPADPTSQAATYQNNNPRRVRLTWRDVSHNETGFVVQRSLTQTGPWVTRTVIQSTPAQMLNKNRTVSYNDTSVNRNVTYFYRIFATNLVGDPTTYAAPAIGFPTKTVNSAPIGIRIATSNNPNPTPFIFANGFEAGLDGWGVVGNVNAVPNAAQGPFGGALGMAAGMAPGGMVMGIEPMAGPQPAYVFDSSPEAETLYDANFYFNPNGAITGETPVDIFSSLEILSDPISGNEEGTQLVFGVQFEHEAFVGAPYELTGWVMQNGERIYTESVSVSNAPHLIEVAWNSAVEGGLSLLVDEFVAGSVSVDTSSYVVDQVMLGPSSTLSGSALGTMFFDEFTSSRLAGVTYMRFLPVITQ